MIYKIESVTEYGKQRKDGSVGYMIEPEDHGDTAYAHGLQDALQWAESFPLWADVKPEAWGDGRYVITSEWQPYEMPFAGILHPEFTAQYEGITHRREVLRLYPLNTIYENTGYARGPVQPKPAVYSLE